MEYIGGRNSFKSEDEALLSRESVVDSPESGAAGVGVVTIDVDLVASLDPVCVEVEPSGGGDRRSGRASFIWLVSAPIARAASLKCARLCAMEDAEDRWVACDFKECTEGSELPEETKVGESVIDSVLGLSPSGDVTVLPARIAFPTSC